MKRNILSENNDPVISFENYFINEMKFRKSSDEDEKNKFGIIKSHSFYRKRFDRS